MRWRPLVRLPFALCARAAPHVEYAYGGHPFDFTGIFENTPRDAEELGENFKFRCICQRCCCTERRLQRAVCSETIEIGTTDFAQEDVQRLVGLLADDFAGVKYHLISNNCNHFSEAFAKVCALWALSHLGFSCTLHDPRYRCCAARRSHHG